MLLLFVMKKYLLLLLLVLPFFSQANNRCKNYGVLNGLTDNLNIKLFSIQAGVGAVETDGVRAKFATGYCTCVDGNDAVKFMASGIENLSLRRDGQDLTIEARPYITGTDTLFLKMDGMTVGGSYEFRFEPSNFDSSIALMKIVDNFLNTETTVSTWTNSTFSFNVTAAAGSSASNRFYAVLYTKTFLPVSEVVLSAAANKNCIKLTCQLSNSADLESCIIEKLANYNAWTTIAESALNRGTKTITFNDNNVHIGKNIYRAKLSFKSGKYVYSNTVSVSNNSLNNQLEIYPNPIVGQQFTITTTGIAKGNYEIKMYNTAGTIVYSSKHFVGDDVLNISLSKRIESGLYTLILNGSERKSTVVFIQK